MDSFHSTTNPSLTLMRRHFTALNLRANRSRSAWARSLLATWSAYKWHTTQCFHDAALTSRIYFKHDNGHGHTEVQTDNTSYWHEKKNGFEPVGLVPRVSWAMRTRMPSLLRWCAGKVCVTVPNLLWWFRLQRPRFHRHELLWALPCAARETFARRIRRQSLRHPNSKWEYFMSCMVFK